ncbi:MAG: diguanylate cyclase domain-containing protein, partial [Microthrixaceae bacterium]
AERLLGMSWPELAGRTAGDPELAAIRLSGREWRLEERPGATALRTGEPVVNEVMGLRRRDGSPIWVRVNATPTRRADGSVNGVVVAFDDVTAEQRLLRDLSRFEFLFTHANDMVTVIDADGLAQYSSPSTERVLGYPEGWHHPLGVLGMVHPDDAPIAVHELASLRSGERGGEPFVVRVRAFDGEWRHVECVGVNLLDEPAVGGIVITARDATERVRLAEEVAHLAAHDELTGLPNRRELESALAAALARARRDGSRVGLCFIDLDGFKGVNDTLGHGAGDQLLVDAAARISGAIRQGDLAARVGGDEFVALLEPVSSEEDALPVARRIRDAILRCDTDAGATARFGASVGLAISSADDTPDSLMHRADAAMYEAKASRDSSICIAGQGLDALSDS